MQRPRITRLTVILTTTVLSILTYSASDAGSWTGSQATAAAGAGEPIGAMIAAGMMFVSTVLLALFSLKGDMGRVSTILLQLTISFGQWLISDAFGETNMQSLPKTDDTPQLNPATEESRSRYVISGDRPRWRPASVHDDGQNVYLRFKPEAAHYKMPGLFVTEGSEQEAPTPYKVQGPFGIVKQLFDVAELRTQGKRARVVRIERRRDEENGAAGPSPCAD